MSPTRSHKPTEIVEEGVHERNPGRTPERIVTAAALFDGHDASISLIRRLLQEGGAEVIHLGHNRSVREIVRATIQEDAREPAAPRLRSTTGSVRTKSPGSATPAARPAAASGGWAKTLAPRNPFAK